MGHRAIKADGVEAHRGGDDPKDPAPKRGSDSMTRITQRALAGISRGLFASETGCQWKSKCKCKQAEDDICCAPTIMGDRGLSDYREQHCSASSACQHGRRREA